LAHGNSILTGYGRKEKGENAARPERVRSQAGLLSGTEVTVSADGLKFNSASRAKTPWTNPIATNTHEGKKAFFALCSHSGNKPTAQHRPAPDASEPLTLSSERVRGAVSRL